MDSTLIRQAYQEPTETGVAATGGDTGAVPAMLSLPPTRTACLARSRGGFFAGGGLARLARWIAPAVCVAVIAISIAATAPRVIDAPVVTANPGPALVAATSLLPAIFAPRR